MNNKLEFYKEKYHLLPIQAKASFWFLVCMLLQKGISVITTPIFTRLLTTEEYGQFNVYNSWSSIISVFVTLRLSYGVYTQGLVYFEKDKAKFSTAIQGLSTFLILIFFGIYLLFMNQWNQLFSLNTLEMCSMFVVMWSVCVFDFWATEERVNFKYKKLVLISLIVSIIQPIIGIIVVINTDDKVTARIISIALISLIAYSGLFYNKVRNGESLYSKKYWLYALKFNIPLIPHYLSQVVLSSADVIMIEKMVGASKSGLYSLAYSIALLMTVLNGAIMSTMSPWIYKKIRDNKVEDIQNITYLILIVVASLNLFFIALAPEIITLFAPKEYYNAVWVIPPVAMSVIFMFSYDLFAKFQFYYSKTIFVMLASVISAILNIILNYIFIEKYGYLAAGYTTLVSYMLYSLGHYLFMNKLCKEKLNNIKPYKSKVLLKIYMIFIILGFMIMSTYNYVEIRYLIILLLLLIVFLKRKQIFSIINKLILLKKAN